MRQIALAIAVLLAGCAGQSTQQTVAQTEVALTAAEKAATLYVTLPLCSATTAKLCSDAKVSGQIKAADQVAFDAVMAARASGDSAKLAAANAAVAALAALIPVTVLNH